MRHIATHWVVVLGIIGGLGAISCWGDLFPVEARHWTPVADDVFLQEIGEKIETETPVTSLALFDGRLFAVLDGVVHRLEGNTLRKAEGAPRRVHKLETLDGTLWALSEGGLFKHTEREWVKVCDRSYVDLCLHVGVLHAATQDDVYRFENGAFVDIKPAGGYGTSDSTYHMEDGTQLLDRPVPFGPLEHILSYSGTLYGLGHGDLKLFDGRIIDRDIIDWGELPSRTTRDMLRQGSRVYIATDRGVAVLRGMALTVLDGSNGLPYADTTCLAPGFDGDLWIGTTRGAIRKMGDAYHYFGYQRWLPADYVRDIEVSGDTAYIATDRGIGIIRYVPYTLQKKAEYYERHMEQWGHLRMGFVHSLYWAGDAQGWWREISDNDGGHTADWLAAMSFKYAVTGDPEARAKAVDAFKAMIWLEDITPNEGYFARAIWSVQGDKGEKAKHGSGGLPARWYPTADGLWEWKGDTSSDEVNAHYYAVSLFHDLAAQGAEKQRAAEHLRRITKHIIDNGWLLREHTGEKTRWGRWDPDYLLRPYGHSAIGLNGMEAQTYAYTALALTGDPVFRQGLEQLLEWRYHLYTVRQKLTFPPGYVVPWDDHLAFMCYYTLLRYADDPTLRSIYLRSIERSWEVKRMEKVAWYNFVYGAATGNDCEIEEAVDYLCAWPLDCVSYSFTNSHRLDLAPLPSHPPYGGGTRAMSPRETGVFRGTRSMLGYDGGSGGRSVPEPTGFILDYWMGRYHGFILPPATNNPSLLTVDAAEVKPGGAAPYDGPPRPKGLIPGVDE